MDVDVDVVVAVAVAVFLADTLYLALKDANWRADFLATRLPASTGSGDVTWLTLPSWYDSVGGMKKTLHIDDELLRQARVACHASTDTDTVRLGLEALVRHAAYERLRALRGAEPRARDVPRRRAQPRSRRVGQASPVRIPDEATSSRR